MTLSASDCFKNTSECLTDFAISFLLFLAAVEYMIEYSSSYDLIVTVWNFHKSEIIGLYYICPLFCPSSNSAGTEIEGDEFVDRICKELPLESPLQHKCWATLDSVEKTKRFSFLTER